MADCERLLKCIFFNDQMENMPGTAEYYKQKYCHGDNTECARHMVIIVLGPEGVPADLFPNQEERAKRILRETKKNQ